MSRSPNHQDTSTPCRERNGRLSPALTLRPTTAEDLGGVAAWESDPDTSPWPGKSARTRHEHAMADPDQERPIAVHAGVPVGFIVLAGLSRADVSVELPSSMPPSPTPAAERAAPRRTGSRASE